MNTNKLIEGTEQIGNAATEILKVAHLLTNTNTDLAIRLADAVDELAKGNTTILKQLETELA